uniref:ACYPI005590 protein n=1 Tax=Acyrthosiphon pisum TaxID=7029 RepID=C4WW59_ACYPI|nr:ACYPI005590 [Acyrthosiphon pisum]
MESVLWLALISAGCLCLASVTTGPVSRKNTFVELDSELLERIELTTEEIARNSTREFVDHEIQAMIDLFVGNLNITIVDLQQYSDFRNSSNFDDTRMKEFQKKGLIMYENTAITIDYVVYKIGVLTKSIEELEQLEKYIIDEEKRLKDLSNNSLQKKTKSVLEKIQRLRDLSVITWTI